MKIKTLSKLIFDEYFKYFIFSIMLIILIDFIFINFTGLSIDKENGYIYWLGGNETISMGLRIILLKTLNISIIFLTIGRIIEEVSRNIMIYVFSRITNYSKFLWQYFSIIVMIGLILLTASHIIYYIFIGLPIDKLWIIFSYLLFDCLGFISIITIYFMLNNAFLFENSFLIIITIYMLNTILPIPIIFATSTVKYILIINQIHIAILFALILLFDFILIICLKKLIQEKRFNLC